tara:strand:+ start:317 stop:514 length:198 start_codon:yes stop_codon:yes gene_type:complete
MRGLKKWQRLQLGNEKKVKIPREGSTELVVEVLGVKGKISNAQFLQKKLRGAQRLLKEEDHSAKE